MNKLNLSLCILFAVMLLNSCSESTSPSNTQNQFVMADYFPTTEGSWWVYKEFETDSLGNRIEIRDSIYIGTKITMAGKEGITQISVKTNGEDISYDTSYFYTEGSKLFVYSKGFITDDESEIEGEWMPYIDLSKDNWHVFKYENHIDTILSNPFIGDSIVYKQDAIVNITGYKNNNKTFSIKGEQIDAKGVKLHFKIDTYTKLDDYEESQNYQYNLFIWVGKGIGIIFTQIETSGITFNMQELLDYHINN